MNVKEMFPAFPKLPVSQAEAELRATNVLVLVSQKLSHKLITQSLVMTTEEFRKEAIELFFCAEETLVLLHWEGMPRIGVMALKKAGDSAIDAAEKLIMLREALHVDTRESLLDVLQEMATRARTFVESAEAKDIRKKLAGGQELDMESRQAEGDKVDSLSEDEEHDCDRCPVADKCPASTKGASNDRTLH